ncbi:MAG: LysM peptidoglycan-binding domain-containing protein [Caldilineaceae bacterium]
MTHNFQLGPLAYVLHEPPHPNRVRSKPGTSAPVVGWLHPGVVMEVTQEPVVVDNVVWYYIQSNYADVQGWTMASQNGEAYIAEVQFEAQCFGTLPSRLQPGDRAGVTHFPDQPNHVRSLPQLSQPAFAQVLNPGDEMLIMQRQGCDGQITWCRVAAMNGLDGWTGECDGSQYWLEPLVINHHGQPAGHYYKVQTGDTLSKIALTFGKTLEQLIDANPGIHNPNLIEIGQRVWVAG